MMESLFQSKGRTSSRQGLLLAESICLTIGFLCLGWFCWHWVATELDQRWTSYKFDSSLRREQPTASGFVRHLAGLESPAVSSPGQDTYADTELPRPAHVPSGETIGRIEIPRLKISAMVRQGVEESTLSRAVGHVPYTALPGSPGNVGLAAHRDTFFRNLRDVRVGDGIRIVTPEGNWHYQVDSLDIVTPKNVEVLEPTPEPALTLVTCYPFNYVGSAPDRFIVRARQVTDLQNASYVAPVTSEAPARKTSKSVVKKSAGTKKKAGRNKSSRRGA